MSASQEPRAVAGLPAWRDPSWWHRAGLTSVLCAMALLLVGPVLSWFHTEMLSPIPSLSGVSPTSFVSYLLWSLPSNISGALGVALIYIFLALGASITGIKTLAATMSRQVRRDERSDAWVGALASLCGASLLSLCLIGLNGSIPFGWPPARIVFDWGYFATLAGFVVALLGNILIAQLAGRMSALRWFDTRAPCGL
jgi:hypothetical protein